MAYKEMSDEEDVFHGYGYGNVVSIPIDSWGAFFSLVQGMRYGEWYFRGHENADWSLVTGLDRVRKAWDKRFQDKVSPVKEKGSQFMNDYDFKASKNRMPFERDLEFIGIREFRSLTNGRFDSFFTNIDYLGAMQHYGTRTRLLDFSFSPFVATFFAFENDDKVSKRAVYAVNANQLKTSSNMMKEVDCFIRREVGDELTEFAKGTLDPLFGNQFPDAYEVYRALANMNIVQSENEAIENNDIIPIVLTGVNNRLVAQDGLFLFPLTFNYFDDVLADMLHMRSTEIQNPRIVKEQEIADLRDIIQESTIVKFVFDECMNDFAHQMLKKMNLTDRVIYPDLVGVARSINRIRDDELRKKGC